MNIRVGVIGTGIMGADHVTTLHRQTSDATVSMVADVISPGRRRRPRQFPEPAP